MIAAEKVHVVARGESLGAVGRRYSVTEQAIAQRNHLKDPNRLAIGQRLIIPAHAAAGSSKYVIKKGDSVALIARKTGVSPQVLIAHNGLSHPDRIKVGQVLRIPQAKGTGWSGPELPSTIKSDLARIRCDKRWKYVIVHHSGSSVDTVRGMNAYHKARGMENGLAYHFVIGNGRKGSGLNDGDIYIGNRWKKQLDGGHVATAALNRKSIGICLVGDFTSRGPSAKQMASLEALTHYLTSRCRIRLSRVKTHREINPRPTECPGDHFPSTSFRKQLGG